MTSWQFAIIQIEGGQGTDIPEHAMMRSIGDNAILMDGKATDSVTDMVEYIQVDEMVSLAGLRGWELGGLGEDRFGRRQVYLQKRLPTQGNREENY